MTTTEIITRCNLTPVPNGRMSRIGWYAGYLVVEYPPDAKYIYGPNIEEHRRDQLLKVPYPDSLLNKWKEKEKWKSHKVLVTSSN